MKRVLPILALLMGGVAWLAWPSPEPSVEVEAPGRVGLPAPAVSMASPEAVVEADPVEDAWVDAVEPVTRDCGLGLRTRCADGTCVSVAAVPPLQGVGGWLAMARTSPALVAAVVAGEVGLPDDAVACRSAVRGLGDREILARAADGGEVWCLTDGSADGRDLCDAVTGLDFASGEDRVVLLH